MPNTLESTVILITGASSGIGASLAKKMAGEGAQCILLSKSVNKLEKLYDDIVSQQYPAPALYPIDLAGANVDDYTKLANIIENEFGRLDCLIHNAAIWKESTSVENSDVKNWFETLNVNLHAPYLLTKACIPLLKKTKHSKILFTDHSVEKDKTAHLGAFTVSKDAIKSLANLLSNELNTPTTQIDVNIVSPGNIRSPMNVRIYPGTSFHGQASTDDIAQQYIDLILEQKLIGCKEVVQLDAQL